MDKMTPLASFRKDFAQKKVLIFGLGILGRAVGDAQFFAQLNNPLRITDLKPASELEESIQKLKPYPIDYTLGEHKKEDIQWADIIIRNAAVPWNHPLLEFARQQQKPIHMSTQLFVQYANCQTIGITGTRGKTTTTLLIHHLLKKLSANQILLGGNIPQIATLPLLQTIKNPATTAVLELSSWQLQSFHQHHLSPNLAVITNFYPDHLNTYPNFKSYINDKKAIYQYQKNTDVLFLNSHQKLLRQLSPHPPSQTIYYDYSQYQKLLHLKLLGAHNLENAAAALAVIKYLKLDLNQAINILNQFPQIPFRLQSIATIQGVHFINDSTSTTPIATQKALASFSSPPILIMGGNHKQLSLDQLSQVLPSQTKHIVFLQGTGTDQLLPLLPPKHFSGPYATLKEALEVAIACAKPQDTILFSPGFTSFASFKNEFDRGQQFSQLVSSR